jgi:hypothetical protein
MTALLPYVPAILVLTKSICLDTNIFMHVLHHMAMSHPVKCHVVLATHDEKSKNHHVMYFGT